MRLALTGTPGTGKTQVGRALERSGFRVVWLNEEAARAGAVVGRDARRGALEVDVRRLDRWVSKNLAGVESPVILEGHLSHHLGVDRAVVLRCAPRVLARRLRRRGWSERKVRENTCAEALGVIVTEAVGRLGRARVFELDTCGASARERAGRVARIAAGGGEGDLAGRVDFLEEAPRWC